MKEYDFSKIFSFKTLGQNKLFLIGIAGILIIFISDLIFTKPENTDKITEEIKEVSASEYEESIENRLVELISNIDECSDVKVMVTLENQSENIYAQSEKTTENDDNKTYENEYIIYEDNTGEKALLSTVVQPKIKGVAVICQGADNSVTINKITQIVATVLNLSTNRIYVTK